MKIYRSRLLVMCTVCALQCFSNLHAEFVTTINAPPDVAPSLLNSDTQLNFSAGATASFISAGENSGESTNVELNISGGIVNTLRANGGSTTNISGGQIGDGFAGSFGIVNISGGTVGQSFGANNTNLVKLIGNDFRLDGVLINGLGTVGSSVSYSLPTGSVLSGTFADGTPFAFSSFNHDTLPSTGGLTLVAAQLPAIAQSLITTPGNPVPLGVRGGQTLVVAPGGTVGDSFNAGLGSALQITGGSIGKNLEAVGASVQMSGGSIGDNFDAFNGSNVTITGGSVGNNFQATNGSVVTLSGGSIGDQLTAQPGSTVNVSGGSIGFLFIAQSGSQVNISGGSIAQAMRIQTGSKATISGYEFRLDGQPISGLSSVGNTKALNLAYPSVLSGTLADGTPFIVSTIVQDQIADGTLTLSAATPLPETPIVFHVPSDSAPLGIRANQTLQLDNGGKLPNDFIAGRGSKLQINGGQVGIRTQVEAATVNITGGSVGSGFYAYNGSVVNISGGNVDPGFGVYKSTVNVTGNATVTTIGVDGGSVVNVSGGVIRDIQTSKTDSIANVSGGIVDTIDMPDGVANISGGISHTINIINNGKVNISGGDFRLNGVPISGLGTIGNSVVQDVPKWSVLTGVLTDGTPFVYYDEFTDEFRNGALKLTASAVPSVGPLNVALPGGAAPNGLRSGQTLTVNNGGAVGDYFTASLGSTLTVNGGHVGDNMNAAGAHITVAAGSIGNIFYAMSGTQLDLQGGKIGDNFRGSTGSVINISGGTTGQQFELYTSSQANISGGSVGEDFQADTGSAVKLIGGEFLLDGAPISGLDVVGNTKPFNLPDGSVLSGTLADGTPFVFSSLDGDKFAAGSLTLQAASLPPVAPSSIVSSSDASPLGARNGQSVVVNGGNVGDNFAAGPGSHVRINSGSIGRNLEAIGAVVDVAGGSVDQYLDAFSGATVNVSGGTVGDFMDAFAGSTINISGGHVGMALSAYAGSKVNVTQGDLQGIYLKGGQLNVSGGGSVQGMSGTGEVNVSGGSFGRMEISGGKLNITGGSFNDIFYVYQNTTITMSGGEVRSGIELFPATGIVFNLMGGSLGDGGRALSGVMNISGGSIGNSFQAFSTVTVNISGGTIGDHFTAFNTSKINVLGGTVGPGFDALSGSVINISGGEFDDGFDALSGSHINILGRAFVLNGVSIGSSLHFNVPFTITNRNVELSGILLDGTPFSFNLNSSRIVGKDYFDKGAFLTVTFVPEPSSLTLLALALPLFTCRQNRVRRNLRS